LTLSPPTFIFRPGRCYLHGPLSDPALEIPAMLRLPRLVPPSSRSFRSLTLAAALAVPAILFAPLASAQDTPPATPAPATPATPAAAGDATTPPATAPAAGGDATPAAPNPVTLPENEPLKDSVENFWHYAKIAQYPLADAEGKRILGQNPDARLLLDMFEAVATLHHDDLDASLLRWQGVDPIKDTSTQLLDVLSKGHAARRADPTYIAKNIQELATNDRGYDLAIDRLRDSGELAVPIMIDDLRKPDMAAVHPAIRRALQDLGLSAVNPLLAATEMHDEQTLMTVVTVLGDLGYDTAVPYLAKLLASPTVPSDVKQSVRDAMRRLRVADPAALSPTDLFYDLGEKFYYDNAAVRADKHLPTARIFYWTEDRGLTFKEVPSSIFHDVMAKRACEYSLKLSVSNDAALSLWLASDFQDEADLPAGQKDPTLPADAPSAHYYGSLSGTRYLNAVLARANRDRSAPVAIRAIQSLQDIGGGANLFAAAGSMSTAGTAASSENDHPLMDALQFPDRLVRYEAAFALASALPRKPFTGQERVVPLLAEALSQTGAANVLVMTTTREQLAPLMDGLRGAGYNVVGGISPAEAVAEAAKRPAIDAILVPEDVGPSAINQLQLLSAQTPRLQRAVKVIITATKASPYTVQAVTDTTMATTQAKPTDIPALKIAIDDARKRGGLLPLDEATSTHYATRAADLLSQIAINHSPVYDVNIALPLLLSAIDDVRPDIVKDDCTVLGVINSPEIQPALLTKAADEHTPDELKIALYKGLATNARNFGNLLSADDIAGLQHTVATAPNVEVRTAAGEARGAMNLPADQAKTLIVDQAKTSE
jgi:DNA-binding NarL/FixJ family response regulator